MIDNIGNFDDDKHVSEDRTKDLPTGHSFEQKVLAWLEAIDARLQVLENKQYDTKPIWENAFKAIADLSGEVREGFADVGAKIDVLASDVLALRAKTNPKAVHPDARGATLAEENPEKKRA